MGRQRSFTADKIFGHKENKQKLATTGELNPRIQLERNQNTTQDREDTH